MKSEVTLGDIAQAAPAIQELMALKLPGKMAVRLVRVSKIILSEAGNAQTVRNNLLKQYGIERKDEPGVYDFGGTAQSDFNAAVMELFAETIELDIPESICMQKLLPHLEKNSVTSKSIYSLMPLFGDIDEEEEEVVEDEDSTD